MPEEIIIEIVTRCLEDMKNARTLTSTSHKLRTITNQCLFRSISSLCPKLTFVDTTALGPVGPLPHVYALIEAYNAFAPLVEGDKGVSCLTMVKGTTNAKLAQIAKDKGIKLVDPEVRSYTDDIPLKETYTMVITNNVTIDSRLKILETQSEDAQRIGGRLPTFQELLALCIFTNGKDSQVFYGIEPRTIGRTTTLTTQAKTLSPLAVGDNKPGSITLIISSLSFKSAITGAGACRRL
jgi:hypothetical protein